MYSCSDTRQLEDAITTFAIYLFFLFHCTIDLKYIIYTIYNWGDAITAFAI